MAQSKLGRGLSSLLPTDVSEKTENTEIDISLLKANPWQPRKDFNDENLEELATSIRNQGIIQPLLVRQLSDKSYEIIAGERRFRAAKLVGLKKVPAYVRSMSDDEVMVCALIENLQRENLNPLEEAQALQTLRDTLKLTQESIAEKIGRSRSAIANALRLLQLSPEAQEDVRSGKLSAGHARALLAVQDADLCESLRSYIVANSLSVRETEELITQWKKSGTPGWSSVEETVQPEKPSGRPKKSEIARKMQALISQVMACRTTVSGNEEQGRITLTYSSSEELQSILQKLGTAHPGTTDPDSGTEPSMEEKDTPSEMEAAAEASVSDSGTDIVSATDSDTGSADAPVVYAEDDTADLNGQDADDPSGDCAADERQTAQAM